VGNVEKFCRFWAKLFQAAVEIRAFADFHGRGIFHQAVYHYVFTHRFH
jgi:hypothetical protein